MADAATWFQWVPVILFVVGIHIKNRRDMQTDIACVKREIAAFQLEVAKEYASVNYLKDVENRIMDRLKRIENKLDNLGHGHD